MKLEKIADEELNKILDELATQPRITRKISSEETEECPIWSGFDQCWIESDDQLRQRYNDFMRTE